MALLKAGGHQVAGFLGQLILPVSTWSRFDFQGVTPPQKGALLRFEFGLWVVGLMPAGTSTQSRKSAEMLPA